MMQEVSFEGGDARWHELQADDESSHTINSHNVTAITIADP